VTKRRGSRAAGVAMAFKLIEPAQTQWRAVNAPYLVALVGVGAVFKNGKFIERPEDQRVVISESPRCGNVESVRQYLTMAALYRSPSAGADLSPMSLCSFTTCASALDEKITQCDKSSSELLTGARSQPSTMAALVRTSAFNSS
jgi:hypothetical protein